MVRRFSWCTVVALVVLLFVATEGLRERSTQVDDQKTLTTRDRGALRFNARSPEEATTSLPFARSKSSRDRSPQSRTPLQERHDDGTSNTETRYESSKRSNFRSKTAERNVSGDATNSSRRNLSKSIDEVRKGEPVINRRSGKRYSTENSEITSMKEEQSVTSNPLRDSTKRPSTRTAHYEVTERLIDNSGPSVFTATTESSRSRTGRKIQTTFASRDFKTQIPASRRFTNKDAEDAETSTASLRRSESRRSTTERIERGTRSGRSKLSNKESNSITRKTQDAILSESESVRVDVPLTVDSTASPNSESSAVFGSVSQPTTTIPQIGKRSDTKESRAGSRRGTERPKGRGRSTTSDSVAPTSRSSRRGPSKFNDLGTTEAGEQNAAWKKNTISRDRSRGPEVKKERARSRNRNFENAVTPSTYDAKRKATGERNFTERRARVSESTTRSVEHRGQDQDGRRGRNRSRVNATTPAASDITSTASPETTVVTEVLTTSTDSESSQSPSSTTPSPSTSTTANPRTLTTTPRSSSTTEGRNRGRARPGQGRVQPKEDFFNHGLGFRGRKPSTEAPPGTNDTRRPTAPRNDSQSHGNPGWTLRRRPSNANGSEVAPRTVVPSVRDQTNEVIPTSEQSTSTDIITTIESSTRRAFKKPQSSTEVSTAVDGSTTKSPRRGNKSFGFGRSSAESEESDNYPPDFKARLSQLKITNMKSTAPKTVPRPSLEVKKSASTTALFAERSRLKLDLARRLVKPELNIEENDLDATTASSSFSKPKPIPKPTDETSKVPEFPKPSLPGRRGSTESSQEDDKSSKLSRPRKYPEDPAKIPSRPTGTKKGKIIAERMVTSISVEERVEETTKSFVATVSTEETAAATTLDPIKVRLSNRGSKRPKEEGTTIQKHAKLPARSNDSVTTFKPKKGYSYQARNRKTQDQATPEPISDATTSNKSSKLASRRRPSEEDKEETISKKSKYIETATKPTFRPRYSKGGKDRSTVEKTEYQATTKLPVATSRYSRKKAAVKTTESKVKGTSTEGPVNHTKKLEFRPRTATYRRHSDVPTTVVESTTKIETTGVAITPRSPKYTPTLSTSTTPAPPVSQEPQLNLMIANDTQQVNDTGITGSSNGDSGNTNVFNPTRTAFITANNASLLEQLRSTVAPLLNSLGNKSPVFSSAYSNVNYANSGPRITPSGSPPRFSARYKGAELFVRKQNNVYQPTVPSITSSSTTPVTPVEGNTPLNTQMGTTSGAMSANAGRLTPIVSTGRPPTDSQGGRIVQDRERDEATRTKEAGGQRSSVYIGQDKFVNYWTDQASTANPRVVSVNINSVATAKNQGPSVAVPSFNNLLNNEPSGRVTAPPGFPWRDPLDQILGITTSSPVITASVASNMLDDSSDSLPARPINPFVEIFTPFRSAIANFVSSTLAPARMSTTTMPTGTAATTTSALPTTTPRTTTPPTTTTTTTTTTTMAPTTTRPLPTITFPPVTNTIARVTITPAPTGTPNSNFVTPPFNLQTNLLPNVQQQNTFGSTFDDLAFLNSLLQSNTRSSTTPKTLTQVEQLLANKILSLALNNPGPTRAPKAIKVENASPNSVTSLLKSSPGPIVIDLLPSSTAGTPTWKPVPTQEQLQKDTPLNNNLFDQTTRGPISSTTVKSAAELNKATANLISTTKAPVTIAAKTAATTPRPKTTTQAPFGLGASLWQALFGGGLFGPSTTPRPVKSKPAKTIEVAQSVSITPKPVPTTQKPQTVQTAAPTTLRSVDISKIEVSTPNSIFTEAKSVTTPSSISTTKLSVATSPKPRSVKETSTFSPEEDAKFLVELLRAVQNDNKASASKKPSAPKQDDESFLRAILSGRAFTTTTAAPSNEISDSALLAALLKAQGIEPPTPATKIREQLLLASIDQGVSLAPTASATTVSTTVATEQASATRPTDTTKKTVTPRPTSRPRIRTTTWSPSSTYPPPLFSSFSNYGIPGQSAAVGDNSGSGALFGATRAFSQLLGAAISGAAQQLQSLVRNGTRIVSEAVG